MSEEGLEAVRYRTLHGPARWLEVSLLCLIPVTGGLFVLEVPYFLGITIFREQFLGLFLALLLGGTKHEYSDAAKKLQSRTGHC